MRLVYFIYILYSEKLNRFYVGTTDDIARRIEEHNNAFYSSSFTVNGIPWILKLSFECQSSEKAYKIERFIKKMKSKVFIEKIIANDTILKDIQDKF